MTEEEEKLLLEAKAKAELEAKTKLKPETPKTDPIPPSKEDNPIVVRYGAKLKVELGDKYSEKFDKMKLESRIDAMEAALDVLGKKDEPVKKVGETDVPLGEKPPKNNKPKSFLEIQNETGYGKKLRNAGSFAGIAKKLYK